MNFAMLRKMRLVNLIVCLAFCLNLGFSGSALAFGKAEKASAASMLRPEAASLRLGNIVLDIEIGKLRDFANQGSKALEKGLADLVLTKDPALAPLMENNIVVVSKDNKTFVVCLIDGGWRIDLSKAQSVIEHFKSTAEMNKFVSDSQLTWIAGNYVPRDIQKAQNETWLYLKERGNAGAIIRNGNIKEAVDKYSAERAKRKLTPLTDKEKADLVATFEAAFVSDNEIMRGLTQENINAMFAIGLSPDSRIKIGAEDFTVTDVHLQGTAVGPINISHLREIGVVDSIVGHSATRLTEIFERNTDGTFKLLRIQPGYTESEIVAKLKEALAKNIKITLCVGETLKIREQDKNAIGFVLKQLDDELGVLNLTAEQVSGLLEAVAYEPLWAINTGVSAKSEQIQEMHAAIRKWFTDKYGPELAEKIVIQYGGSVKEENAAAIFALKDVNGALIGGASLKAGAFSKIAQIAEATGKHMLISANWKTEEAGKRDVIATHLKALADVNLKNTAVNYYLPFTLLSQAKDLLNKAKAPAVAVVKDDLKNVDLAFVFDDTGKPYFWNKGEIGTSKHAAVTLSSGGFEYAGYSPEKTGGKPARSFYDPFTMQLMYMQMEKTDPKAKLAYILKRLHDYFEVSSEGIQTHRQETKEVADLINEYDKKAFAMWKQLEVEKATARILQQENKKTIAETTSANIGKFLKGGVILSDLINVAEAKLQELVKSGLLTGYRIVIKDGKINILTTRQNSKAIEDDAKVPSAILDVYLSVLNAAKEKGIYVGEEIGKSYRKQTDALELSVPLPTLTYLQPEGWAKSYFGKIRTELKVPEGQPAAFFTTDQHGYTIGELFAKPVKRIPDAVVEAVRNKLDQDVAEGKLLGADVRDFIGTVIKVHVTHRYGELNAAVQRLVLEAMREGCLKAQELGLLKKGIDVNSMSLEDLAKAMRVKYTTHSITERGAEPVVKVELLGAGIGAVGIKVYHEFFMPGSTPLQKLGFVPEVGEKDKPGVRGFRAIVRRTEDVLRGNFDGPVWEFEKSAACTVKGKFYPSKDESLELLALVGQSNDFLPTAIYTVEGSTITSTEPIVSIEYQPVYSEKGGLRALNPTLTCRSQSGADAVAGVAAMFYDVNSVPGGPNGERFVFTRPATLEEAREAPPEGIAYVVVYGWQSRGNGVIPREKGARIDHVAINPQAFNPERKLANFLASIMITHQYDQPYLSPAAAQERIELLRKEQAHLFGRAPKDADIDSYMDWVEAEVAAGRFLSVVVDKADMGGELGHNFTPPWMLAIDRASVMEAQENGMLSDGNIIGFTDKGRLKRGLTLSIGDDGHIIAVGDKTRNNAQAHQLSFLAFTRGYFAAVAGNGKTPYSDPMKCYGLAQDYQGKEAKAAKANPIFYSHFTPRFFEILRETMPGDFMPIVDNMEKAWKEWQKTSATVTLPEPFSGNVSQQGIGTYSYRVDMKGGERHFGILAGDKMGPAGINRIIREGVYALLKASEGNSIVIPDWITNETERNFFLRFIEELKNGLVFEIWDAKAFDKDGKIPLDKLPKSYADVADAINELKDKKEQDFVKSCYGEDGLLKEGLRQNQDLIISSFKDAQRLAELLKKGGYVPTERIYLDAKQDKEAIYAYLADSDRFNIKQVWDKKQAGWDIRNPQAYLNRPILGSSVTKLGILAGGEYVGKDDPGMVGNTLLMESIFAFLKDNPVLLQGDMNGSHWLGAIPTAAEFAVANKESHPILVGFRYTFSEDGKTLAKAEDVFGNEAYNVIRDTMFQFNFEFKRAQLGGQFEPYGTNERTVEASYPVAKFIRALQSPNSPFLVKNKPAAERKLRPIGLMGEVVDLFKTATGSIEMPTTPEGWSGADESAERFSKSLLAQQGPIGGKLNDTVTEAAKGEKKFILIKADSALESDTSLISTLQNINSQINQSLGVFGSDANIAANAYQFLLVFDRPELNTAQNVERLFADIAKTTKNGAKANKDIAAKILTQEDMYEGAISNAADLLKQLKRMGISEDLVAGLVGPKEWTTGIKAQKGIAENVVVGNTDAEKNKIAFAGNALFAVVEAVATADRKVPDSLVKQLGLAQEGTSIVVNAKPVSASIVDEIEAYRNQIEERRRA